MKKRTTSFFTILVIVLLSIVGAKAQSLTKVQEDSIAQAKAEAYFSQAFSNENDLTNQERIDLFHTADGMFRELGDWKYSFVTITYLCNLYQIERSYEKIDQLSKEAFEIVQTHLTKEHRYYGVALNIRANALWINKSDFTNAIEFFKKSIKFNKENNLNLSQVSTIYFNLGSCYQEVGDYDQAIDQLYNGLRIQLDSLDSHPALTLNIYNQLGLCYSKKNQFDLAIQDFEKGIKYAETIPEIDREANQVILYLYQNLADLYLKTNKPIFAKKYIRLALAFQKDQNYLRENYTYQLQGNLFLKEKENNAALEVFRKNTTLAQTEFKNFDKHLQIGHTYFHTGNAWLAQGILDSALQFYQLALINSSIDFESSNPIENPLMEKLTNPLTAIDIFEGKAKTYTRQWEKSQHREDLKNAFDNYALAVDAISKTRLSFNAEGSKHTLAEKVIPVYEGAIETAFKLYEVTKEREWLETGFQFAEGNKAAALFDAIQKHEALNMGSIPDSLLKQEYDLKVEIAFYEKLIHEDKQHKETISPQKIKELENSLSDYKESYQKLIDLFEDNYPDYFALKFKQESIDVQAIQQKLGRSALVEFFVGIENIYVFTITNKQITCHKTKKTITFEEDVKTLRTIITSVPSSKTILSSLDDFSTSSNRLYKQLLEKSIRQLSLPPDHLIVIPDDLLAYLPFSVFIEEPNKDSNTSFKKLSYLSNRFGISYNYSTALWFRHLDAKPKKTSKQFIGFAPEFSAYKNTHLLSPLSCNTSEVDQIGELLSAKDLHFAADASLEGFKDIAADYQVIHLATHATLDNQNSAFNRIYFSDEYLSQNDLYQLNLNASLVVLSACNTGSGTLKKGEGVMSLSRGFIHAGCPSILMSLWSVDDCVTADIMLDYYKDLNNGKSKEMALRAAKSNHLSQVDDILQAHPYYWAAFVQYGNTEPLELNPSKIYIWFLGVFIVIALLLVLFFNKTSKGLVGSK